MRWKQTDKKKSHDIPTKEGSAKGKRKESEKEIRINEETSSSKADPRREPSRSVPHALGGGQRETERLSTRSRETVDRDLEWWGSRETPCTSSPTLQAALRDRFGLQVSVSQINRVRAALGVSNPSKRSPHEKKRKQGLLRQSQSG
jgi:hypothetical protein